jgi:hypothetical protein
MIGLQVTASVGKVETLFLKQSKNNRDRYVAQVVDHLQAKSLTFNIPATTLSPQKERRNKDY